MIEEVEKYINAAEPTQVEVLTSLRLWITEAVPEAEEFFKWGYPVYGKGKDFCYLKSSKKHATLGFMDFEKIKTRQDLLEGTGKKMRHIKIKNLEDIDKKEIVAMIKESAVNP